MAADSRRAARPSRLRPSRRTRRDEGPSGNQADRMGRLRQVGQRGSHRQFKHPTKRGKVTVPGHPNDDLGPEMRANILRQAGLKR
ncbi:MAG TPA: type II toxin-antitoxin system HicA family toxin [Solirubrobacteraceae bacterium]